MFKAFLTSLKQNGNEFLIESMLKGYETIFETKMMKLSIPEDAKITMSEQPIENIRLVEQQWRSFKPKGLWYWKFMAQMGK
jgi:hypothetical protein